MQIYYKFFTSNAMNSMEECYTDEYKKRARTEKYEIQEEDEEKETKNMKHI